MVVWRVYKKRASNVYVDARWDVYLWRELLQAVAEVFLEFLDESFLPVADFLHAAEEEA